jgi:Reverse transcriptase (RNA-dependent DNA polymerase)
MKVALEKPFTELEIKDAVFGSGTDKAEGPDGLPFMFYQNFWEQIKTYLINILLFGSLDVRKLNHAMICLIPKTRDAQLIKQFRPISLINCSYKIISKILTTRLMPIMQRLIGFTHNAFISGRYFLESVLTAHELIHHVHKRKDRAVLFQIDFEKVDALGVFDRDYAALRLWI